MKIKISFDNNFSPKKAIEYWYNKALAPFGVLFLSFSFLTPSGSWALVFIAGIMVTLGFLTELHFEEEKKE